MWNGKFINEDGLKNLSGHVNATFVDLGTGYEIHWICPYCNEKNTLDAVQFMVEFCIEDSRTAFANCRGRDYAVIAPKLMPPDLFKSFSKERAS